MPEHRKDLPQAGPTATQALASRTAETEVLLAPLARGNRAKPTFETFGLPITDITKQHLYFDIMGSSWARMYSYPEFWLGPKQSDQQAEFESFDTVNSRSGLLHKATIRFLPSPRFMFRELLCKSDRVPCSWMRARSRPSRFAR